MKIILLDFMLKKNNHNYPFKKIFYILDNKFKFEIIYYLIQKKMRFGEIKNRLLNINQQLLTKLLKQLEKDKLIKKKQTIREILNSVNNRIGNYNFFNWSTKNNCQELTLEMLKVMKIYKKYAYFIHQQFDYQFSPFTEHLLFIVVYISPYIMSLGLY